MSTDKRGTKILARTFFNQLRTSGYTPNEIIAISTELIDLLTTDLREHQTPAVAPVRNEEQRRVA